MPNINAQVYRGFFDMLRIDWQYAERIVKCALVTDSRTFDTRGYRNNRCTERKKLNGKLSFSPTETTNFNLVLNQLDIPPAQYQLGLTAAQHAVDLQQT